MAGKADDLKIAYSISVVIGDLSERRGIKIPRGSGIDAKAMQKIAFERVVDQIRTAGISVTQSKVEQIVKAHNLGTAKGRDAFLRPAAQQKRADARAAKAEAKAREKGVVKSNVDFARAIAARQAKIPYQAPKRAADKSSRARTQMPVEPPIKRSELRLARRLFPGISDKEAQANREHVRRAVLRGASSLGGAAGRRTDRFIETGYRGLASHTPGVSRPAPASITRMATAKYTPTPTYSYQASSSGALGAGATGSTARGTRFFTADQAAFMRSDPRAVRQYMKLRRSDAGRKITVTQRIPGSQSIPARTVSTPLRGAARAGKIVDLMRADRSVRAIEARTPAPSGRPFSPGTASGTMSTTRQSKESITQYSESRFSGNPEHEARIARLHSRSVSAAEKIFGQGPGKEGSDLLRGSAARNYAHAVESEQAKTGIRNINDPTIIKAIDARISSPSFEANVIRSSKAAIGGMDARDITGRIKELASSKNPADVAIAKQIVSDYMPGKIDVDKIASRAAKDREAKAKEPVKAAEPKKVSARAKPRTEEFKKHEKETQRRAAANAAAGKGEKPYPKATGDRLSIAKLAGLRAPMQTSSGFSSGPAYKGIISNDDIVGALKARAAGKHPSGMEIGSKKEIADRQMIANTIAGKVAGSQAVSGAPKAILEAFAADPKLAEFYLGQGATALTGVKGKDIERPMTKKEILDEFAAKSAKGAPVKKTKAPAAKKTPKPAPAPTKSATVKPETATAAAAPAASGGSGGSGGGGGGSRGGGSGAEKAMEDRFNRGGGLEGKIRQIDGALEAKGVPPEKRAQILSDIRSAHGQITASGMSDFQAAKSLGFAGTGISKNLEGMAKISPESKEYKSIMQGAIDRALGRKPADAAPVIKEPKAAPAEKKKPAETPAAAKKKATPKPEPKPVAKPAAKTKTAPKPAAKPAEEKKKETARKTAEKKAEQVKKQSEKKVSAPAKPKAIKPMSQEKQRSELAKAAGYRGGAAEAYKSLLRKGVEPQAAKGIVDDGRNSGIKGKQLVDYANRRQKGMDHENAKTAATAKKVGGAPSGPAKAGGKAAAGSSGGSNKPPRGTTSGGRFARGPRGSSGGMSPGIFGQAASGADRGVVGAVKNSIGQITQSLLTAQVIAKVGSLIQQITGGLIGFNMKLEESTIAFKTLFINEQRALGTFMGDTTQATIKANILTKAIQDFANVTPFRFGELVTAAERMKAFGFETKEILPSLQGIGDAVAALGGEDDKLRRITYALGQMKQAGRVYQNDMMQLSNAGIAGYEILAKGLIEEFIKTGRVMVGESGNLYKYNTETIDQVVTDIVKNKGQGVYKVMSAQSNKLMEIFNDLTTEPVEKIRNMTKRGSIDGAAAARYIIKGMEKTYQGGMEALARTMKGAISTVQDTSQYLIAVSFKPIYDHIRNFFYEAGQFMMKAGGKRIADGIAKAITPIGDAAAEAFPKVASFFGEMISAIMTASGNFTKSMAKIQVGAQTLAEYIRDNLVGGMKSVLEILKTDFGQAAIAAVAAMRIIQSAAAANPIVIALGAIVMAMGAVTSGMNKFIKTGSLTRDSIETITEEEQNTALAGIQIKEAFIEIGNAIKKAKKQLGPSLTRIFTELAKVLANVGSKAITVIVDVIKAITDVISGILGILSRMPGALSVALAAFVAFKIGASGLALATTAMNALATSMLAVAGAANAIKTGGVVGLIGSILGGGLVQSGARALSGIATGAQIASVAAQTQAFNTGGAVRKLALGEATSSVAITGGGIKQILSGSGKAAAGAADDVAVAAGTAAAPAARTTGIISRIGGVISGVVNGISKLAGGIRMGAGKFTIIAFVVLTVIKHIGKLGEVWGAVAGAIGRTIGKIGEITAAIGRLIAEIPLVGPVIQGTFKLIDLMLQGLDDAIDVTGNTIIKFFNEIFPESEAERAIRIAREINEEIAELIEMGYSADQAKELAEAIAMIRDAINKEKSNDLTWDDFSTMLASGARVGADAGFTTPDGSDGSGRIPDERVIDLRDQADEIMANLDDTAKAQFLEAIKKAIELRDQYKQILMDAGMSEEKAAELSGKRYNENIQKIISTVSGVIKSGRIGDLIPSITKLTEGMGIGFGNAADGADAFGVSIDKLQNGDVLAYITDVNGILEKITLQGETAANASQIETIIQGIAGQTRDQAVETGAVPNQAAADKIFEDTKRFYNPKFADAIEGFYTNPITGVREFLGRTIAVRKLLADIKVVAGEVDLGQIYSETVESKLEKAKSAIEKIKSALDPIVDRILSRIRNAAEKQFADRIENVTKILEEQRDAEIDAIQVRIDGINTTYGILDDEIKAQEKKNRVIQIEKTLLDARKNVADAAIAAYGEDVDPIAAAIARREAEISMTEAVKDAELERKKLALDEQQSTIAGIQAIFDIRIEIVTDALEQEKMAFFENIDDIVAKIKEGTITGAAAVAALSSAFKNFGLTIPSTAQAIAASGTNTIGSLFTKIIAAIDAYRNKLLQVKAIEDTLGDDMADDPPTKEEIDYMKAVAEQEAERKRKSAIAVGKSTAFESIGSVFNEMLRQSMYGKDGKPIAKSLRDKRDKEYNVQAKALTASLPKAGDFSEAALAKMSAGWLAWTTWLSSVDLMSALPRAKGGPVASRGQYLVGEKGPELITMGNGSGQVISNFYVKKLTDAFKSFRIGNPAIMPKMAYNMGGGGKAEFSVTINNPQVRTDSDVDKIVEAVNRSQMRMARRLGYS